MTDMIRPTAAEMEYVPDPDPRGLEHHGGAQCEARDGGYRCTMVADHPGADHHTWASGANRAWTSA